MTIKEIAELCGIDRTTALRWVRKVADDPVQNAQGFYEKLAEAEKSGTTPTFKVEKLPELFRNFDKFKEQTLAAYKKIESQVELLENLRFFIPLRRSI